jgi:hypothetical protein
MGSFFKDGNKVEQEFVEIMLKQEHKTIKQHSRIEGGNLGKTTIGNFYLSDAKIYSLQVSRQVSLTYKCR